MQNQNNQFNQNNPFNGNMPPYQNTYYTPPVFHQSNGSVFSEQQYNDLLRHTSELNIYKAKRSQEKKELILTGVAIGSAVVAYIIVQSIVSSFLIFSDTLKDLYYSSSLFQSCFNIIGVHLLAMAVPFGIMSLLLKNRYRGPIIPNEKIGFAKGLAWVGVGMGGCMIANIATSLVIKLFEICGYELQKGELSKPDSIFACVCTVVATAIVPAVVEEYAMRCCTMGALKKYGKGFAVFAVSIVFGLLHLNVIQFVFAFLVGLILGYVTVKTNSIVPAIFIHGFNNGLSVVQDVTTYFSNENVAENVITVLYYIWIAAAFIGLIYLAVKKDLFIKKENSAPKEPFALSFGTKLLCLLPGLAVPLICLIWFTTQTIVPIS